jgi:hypothetical protein
MIKRWNTLKRTHNIKKNNKKKERKRSFEWILVNYYKEIKIEIQWNNSEDLRI